MFRSKDEREYRNAVDEIVARAHTGLSEEEIQSDLDDLRDAERAQQQAEDEKPGWKRFLGM